MTKSEILFEKYCTQQSVKFNRINTDKTRTADYLITVDNYIFIVEVTELIKNKEEIKLATEFKNKDKVVYWPKTEKRIRQKITDKKTQIKNLVDKYRCPSILLLYDNRCIFKGINEDNIKYSMYGKDSHIMYYYNEDFEDINYGGEKFGGSRKMTTNQKTYISAISHLYEKRTGLGLSVYHNYFAVYKFDIGKIYKFTDQQFTIENPHEGGQNNWELVTKI